MQGSYDLTLVFASYCVAVIAAYTAIYFGTKLFSIQGSARKFWLGAGAVCLGSGIWSMHFVGMSAYTMPGDMVMSFSLPLTVASWVPAVAASALALLVITRESVGIRGIASSAVIMGAGICAMHYGGMYAMQMQPAIVYDQLIVAISALIAVVASGAALVICRQVRVVPARYALAVKTLAALIMGAAICGMHYTGMAAASYPMDASMASSNALSGGWMGAPTAIVASVFLLLALVVAFQDFRQAERERHQAARQHQKVQDDAFRDPVTGIGNRSELERQLMAHLAGRVGDGAFSILCLELPQYRERALQIGEAQINASLRQLTDCLQEQLPSLYTQARLSSSSFAVLLPILDIDAQPKLVAQLATAIKHHGLTQQFGEITLGFSEFPKVATNSRLLIREAQKPKYSFNSKVISRRDGEAVPI